MLRDKQLGSDERSADIEATLLAMNNCIEWMSFELANREETLAQIDAEYRNSMSFKVGRFLCLGFR